MSRYFVGIDSIDIENNSIIIAGEDVKHIRNVLRNKPGDMLILSDGIRYDYEVIIETIEKETVYTKIVNKYENKTEPPVNITLLQGIPKADKMEYIIQKCVELGVNTIVPVLTARSVVRLTDPKDVKAKTIRWSRIAQEAAKQCDRGIIPTVTAPVKFDEALELACDSQLKLLPYEEETEGSLRDIFKAFREQNCDMEQKPSIVLFIGPEGGFAAEEVERASSKGFNCVTLGPRILRTETAGIAVISVIMYELGDMSKA